jgi:hypothetical protein
MLKEDEEVARLKVERGTQWPVVMWWRALTSMLERAAAMAAPFSPPGGRARREEGMRAAAAPVAS